ncbi:MAG: thiol:disulfide interchange protein [Gammaproteobacteria bacterium HGW-Gammaproteobacteria-3]|nr:MAG: thiol:disulfide interchange protein [Gammaproteobacteria bacterium HGW-Gammaproteobacteria-3]
MHSMRLMLLAVIVTTVLGSQAHAISHEAATEQVTAQLIASVDAVRPGDEILVGVQQRIIPHWHTYWVNPGDSGLATKIDYTLPEGASVGDIQWPTPSLIQLGPVINYGYENEVTLLSPLSVPKDAVIGERFPIQAKVKWLVCEEVCIPQQVDLALELPIVSFVESTGPGSPLIERALASLPVTSPWPIDVKPSGDDLTLRISGSELSSAEITTVRFYPEQWGRISHGAPQQDRQADDAIELTLRPGEAPLSLGEPLVGVLTLTENIEGQAITRGYIVNVPLSGGSPDITVNDPPALLLPSAMLLALLGGVILNLMPCVFPVLSIKALSLIQHAHEAPRQTQLQGWAYTSGILASFALLGGLLIALKTGGAQIGWGFQFQSPLFVLAVAYLMFAVGLSLSGVFTIGNSIVGVGSSLAQRSGYSGSFFTGVLATIVATPCTAPFMGVALGFALSQSPVVLLAVFLSLGFGLALPYLLLSYWPALQRRLPKPGVWMDRLKQGLAFPMYGAAVWLVWVLAQQAGLNAVAVALGGMVAISFAAWLYETTKYSNAGARRSGAGFAGVALAAALLGGYGSVETPASAVTFESEQTPQKNWEPYSALRLAELRAEGKPVFLNFTAAWCISCLVNERVALSQASVIDAFEQSGITYLKGDWTNRDAEITKILAEFGRSGVPLYVYYPAGIDAEPEVLPQLLTPEIVTQTVTAPSKFVSLAIRH